MDIPGRLYVSRDPLRVDIGSQHFQDNAVDTFGVILGAEVDFRALLTVRPIYTDPCHNLAPSLRSEDGRTLNDVRRYIQLVLLVHGHLEHSSIQPGRRCVYAYLRALHHAVLLLLLLAFSDLPCHR